MPAVPDVSSEAMQTHHDAAADDHAGLGHGSEHTRQTERMLPRVTKALIADCRGWPGREVLPGNMHMDAGDTAARSALTAHPPYLQRYGGCAHRRLRLS